MGRPHRAASELAIGVPAALYRERKYWGHADRTYAACVLCNTGVSERTPLSEHETDGRLFGGAVKLYA